MAWHNAIILFPVFLELAHETIFVLEYFVLLTDNCLSDEESRKITRAIKDKHSSKQVRIETYI